MPYATLADLIARFGADEVADLTTPRDAAAPDPALGPQALADASVLMDGYIGSQYVLPLTTLPPILGLQCCNIARYLLCPRPTDEIRKRHDDALAWLGQVARGTIGLGLDAAGRQPPTAGGADGTSFQSGGRVFSEELLKDFRRGNR